MSKVLYSFGYVALGLGGVYRVTGKLFVKVIRGTVTAYNPVKVLVNVFGCGCMLRMDGDRCHQFHSSSSR